MKHSYDKIHQMLLKYIPGMIYIGNPDWTATIIGNPELISGYTAEELMSDNISWLDLIHDDDRKRVVYEARQLQEKSGHLVQEYRIIDKKNNIRWVSDNKTSKFDENNNFIGVDGIVTDITEKKFYYEQMLISEKLSAVGLLSTGIAHEFNNLLLIIYLNADLSLLENSKTNFLPEKIVERFKSIIECAEKGKKITSQIADFTTSKSLNKTACDISSVLDSALEFQKAQLKIENIKIEKKIMFNKIITIDKIQFEQVFFNLILNARHAILAKGYDSGKISIEIFSENNNMIIIFKDTGIGIKQENHNNIFLPFYSTKSAYSETVSDIQGTGLGLSIVYKVIQNHNGTIAVESEENHGTVFRITIPVSDNADTDKTQKSPEPKNPAKLIDKNISILVVDDDNPTLNLISTVLTDTGYKNISIFDSPKNALLSFNKNKFDIALIDFKMPNINGIELAQIFKKLDSSIKIAFMTCDTKPDKKQIKDYAILLKPFRAVQLNNLISDLTKK